MLVHLLLYGDRFDQESLQTSLYALYNTEIDVVVNLFQKYPGITKRIQKTLTKNANAYLLDKLELNTKTRCILAWSGMFIYLSILYFSFKLFLFYFKILTLKGLNLYQMITLYQMRKLSKVVNYILKKANMLVNHL